MPRRDLKMKKLIIACVAVEKESAAVANAERDAVG